MRIGCEKLLWCIWVWGLNVEMLFGRGDGGGKGYVEV